MLRRARGRAHFWAFQETEPLANARARRTGALRILESTMRKKPEPMAFWTSVMVKDSVTRVARLRNQSVASCLELAAMQFVERESHRENAKATAMA